MHRFAVVEQTSGRGNKEDIVFSISQQNQPCTNSYNSAYTHRFEPESDQSNAQKSKDFQSYQFSVSAFLLLKAKERKIESQNLFNERISQTRFFSICGFPTYSASILAPVIFLQDFALHIRMREVQLHHFSEQKNTKIAIQIIET